MGSEENGKSMRKWQKYTTNQIADRISALPDEILCHIFSFLRTEVAVGKAQLVCKRWRTQVQQLFQGSHLHFDDRGISPIPKFNGFVTFVDAVMLSQQQQQPIKSLHLHLVDWSSYCLSQFNVDQWLGAAIRRGVENLTLFLRSIKLSLPPCILSCQTLVLLDLTGISLANIVSSSVRLPSLKILRLRHIKFEARANLRKLLSGCPNLEDLRIIPHLFWRDMADYTPVEYTTFPKLIRAETAAAYTPIRLFYNVEFLRIIIAFGTMDTSYYNAFPPVFNNLIHIDIWVFPFTGWDLAIQVLQQSPKLQIFIIKTDEQSWPCPYIENWTCPTSIPQGLRTMSLNNFVSSKDGLRFATYIMQNANTLRVMRIRCSDPTHRVQILNELSSCPRISPACKLFVE